MNRLAAWLWRLTWRARSARATGLDVGDVFPDFALRDVTGRTFHLSRTFPGRRAVLWFTNLCEDCQSRASLLAEICEDAADRYAVAAVSIVPEADTRRLAGPWPFPVLLDPEDVVARRLGLPHPAGACPLHNLFILDETGRIVFRHHLSAIQPDELRARWRGPTPRRASEISP